MFRLALIQMSVVGGEKAANLARAAERVRAAASAGAQVALLPECMDLGWTDPSARTDAEPIPGGEPCETLRALARKCRLYVCGGLVERDGPAVYNSAILVSPQGEILLHHRKLNELEIGHPYYAQGDRLAVCHTELGAFGLMICADGFAKDRVISRSLGYMGADIILSPSAWAVPPDHDNHAEPYGGLWDSVYQPVCREFSLWIASASNVGRINAGPWKDQLCIGCSRIVSPAGATVLAAPYGADADTVLTFDIEPVERPARGCGWANP